MSTVNNKINIQLKASDKASKAFKKLANSSKKLSDRLKTNSARFKKMGAVWAVSFWSVAFGVKKLTDAYDRQIGAEKQVQQGIESTGAIAWKTLSELKKTAADLQKNSIFWDEDILQHASAQILTFTNITWDQFDRVQQASLDLTTRLNGVDATWEQLKSTSIQLGKALNDPIANLSALSRSWIQFSTEQKETIKALWETWRAAEAQTLILDELDRQYGWSAKAAADAKWATHQLSKSFWDMLEIVWGWLKPAIEELSLAITPVITKFSKFASENPELIKNIALISLWITGLLVVLWTLGLVVPVITAWFWALATASGVLWGALMFLAANPIWLVITAIASWIAIWVLLVKNWDTIKAWAEELWHKMFELKERIWLFADASMVKLWAFKDGAIWVFSGVKTWALETMESMKQSVVAKFESMLTYIKWALQKAKDTAREIATLWLAKTQTYNSTSVSWTKANGWPVKGWSAYMVWERWPEMFVPESSWKIVPSWGGWVTLNMNMGWVTVSNSADEDRLAKKIENSLIETLQMYKFWIS